MKKATIFVLTFLMFTSLVSANGVTLDPENPTVNSIVTCLFDGQLDNDLFYVWLVNNRVIVRGVNPVNLADYDLNPGDRLKCNAWVINPNGQDHLLGSSAPTELRAAIEHGTVPVVTITNPDNEEIFLVNREIRFEMDVTDQNGNDISEHVDEFIWDLDFTFVEDGEENIIIRNEDHSYTYNRPGVYTVVALATMPADLGGFAGFDFITITVEDFPENIEPEITVRVEGSEPGDGRYCTGELVTFDASRTTDNRDNINELIYSWQFGDGREITRQGQPRTDYIYRNPGVYEIILTVTDSDGNSAVKRFTIRVHDCEANVHPEIENIVLEYEGNEICPRTNVIFEAEGVTDNRDNLENMEFRWNFGDGQVFVGQGVPRIAHVYNQPGVYMASLTVIDSDRNAVVESRMVVVNPCGNNIAPLVVVQWDVENGEELCIGKKVKFDASRTTDNRDNINELKFKWDLGDGQVREVFGNPFLNYVYGLPGNYEVTLTVTDLDGNPNSIKFEIVMEDCREQNAPVLVLEFNEPICAGKKVKFDASKSHDDLTADEDLYFIWRLGDPPGAQPDVEGEGISRVEHVYENVGRYRFQAVVWDNGFGDNNLNNFKSDFETKSLEVVECPVPARHDNFDVVSVRPLTTNNVYKPGETVKLVVSVRNLGNVKQQNIAWTTSINNLGVYKRERAFTLGVNDVSTQFVDLKIPGYARSGWYSARMDFYGDRGLSVRENWAFKVV